jgi:serine/threonine protein kinase
VCICPVGDIVTSWYYRLSGSFFSWAIVIFADGKGPILSEVECNEVIARNVLNVFKEIHTRKECHRDIRQENIHVKSDNSVVIVDFERSSIDATEDLFRPKLYTSDVLPCP